MKLCIHCTEPANNGTLTLCNAHTDKLRKLRMLEARIRLTINKLSHKYYIQDGDLGVEYRDSGAWRSYVISDACGDTEEEFLETLIVSEIDQDGGEIDTYGFADCSNDVQFSILKQAGIDQEKYK